MRRIMIAAPSSGSGKTVITCMFLQALKNRNEQVRSFKCGPDYIDPMFHKTVLDIPAGNLDTFFTNEKEIKALFLQESEKEDFVVLEGVMGIFDGLGGFREEGSSYHLAKVTKTPIVFVVDAKGMGRSIIALIAGFLAYDKEHLIQGVILNKMSRAYYEVLKSLIEKELKIAVLGYLPKQKELSIESRHLGLIMPNEHQKIKEHLLKASEEFERTVSVEKMIQIAETAGNIEYVNNKPFNNQFFKKQPLNKVESTVTIAVARDEAFCFYYVENFFLLQQFGAKLIFFSPLHDNELPKGCDALLIGGGYPELYMKELSENKAMHTAIKHAADMNMPIVAECGGFMYLHSAIVDKEGNSYAMAGVLPGTCYDTGKLVRFGYIELTEKHNSFLPEGEKIKGHEFHYFDSTDNGSDCLALKPTTGRQYACVIEQENCWMGFPHLYYPSNPAFVERFVRKIRETRKCESRIGIEL